MQERSDMPKRGSAAASTSSQSKRHKPSRVHFVLAHSAGHHPGGAQHPTMQRWAAALKDHGTVHETLVYPKPFNLMPRLTAAHAMAIEGVPSDARVVLVGIGMGARVAVHLMGGTPGDDGKPLPPVAASTRERVVLMIAIDYPLLRVGTREMRSAPLIALPSTAPRTLFVHGLADKHSDEAKLRSVIKQMRSDAELLTVQGGSEKLDDDGMSAVVKRIVSAI